MVSEIKALSLLQIPEVIKFCCDFLMSWVDEENILDVYKLADHYDLRHLSDQLDSYILKNFAAFSRTQAYRQLPLQKVYSLLSSNRLEVNYEFEVYDGALFYHYSPEQLETDQVSLMEPLTDSEMGNRVEIRIVAGLSLSYLQHLDSARKPLTLLSPPIKYTKLLRTAIPWLDILGASAAVKCLHSPNRGFRYLA